MVSFVITIDGVMADQEDESSFAAARFLPEGAYLYKGLAALGEVSLISLQSKDESFKVEYWLKAHGFTDHARVLYDEHSLDPARGVDYVLAELRKSGPVDLVVEGNPERAARFLHHGASTCVVSLPTYTRGEFRPGTRTPRAWDEVIAELDAQRGISEEDARLDGSGTSKFME